MRFAFLSLFLLGSRTHALATAPVGSTARTILLLAVVVLCSVIGDLSTKHGMKLAGAIHSRNPVTIVRSVWQALWGGWVILGVCSMVVAFLALMVLLSGVAASSVIPATAATFVMNTFGARLLLKERVTKARWAGAGLVATGVALVSQ